MLYYTYEKWLNSDSSDPKEDTCEMAFRGYNVCNSDSKRNIAESKLSILEESQIETNCISELG